MASVRKLVVGGLGALLLMAGDITAGATTADATLASACPESSCSPQKLNATAFHARVRVLSRELEGHRVQIRRATDDQPVEGLRVTFHLAPARNFLCEAHTDRTGTASCAAGLPGVTQLGNLVADGYVAVFAGNARYLPAQARASYDLDL